MDCVFPMVISSEFRIGTTAIAKTNPTLCNWNQLRNNFLNKKIETDVKWRNSFITSTLDSVWNESNETKSSFLRSFEVNVKSQVHLKAKFFSNSPIFTSLSSSFSVSGYLLVIVWDFSKPPTTTSQPIKSVITVISQLHQTDFTYI